ncbi:MAG TPA: GNAT family N-acetyltransferase [Chitinophagaceae bacterium]|nr:GNAT family N-acetyltransferase [Chitinophagaceae bacterium]
MIRRAHSQDLSHLTRLLHAYRLFYQKAGQEEAEYAFLQERLTREDSLIYLGFSEQDPEYPVGFAQVYHAFSTVQLGPILILNDLYVEEAFRGRGLGTKLIGAVIRYMEDTGCRKILLQTNRDNYVAQRLYERMGFIQESHSHFYEYMNR